ncbi:MAG: indolepyruvate oxidoreductase subunit beta [Chloroflexota bacterium]|jgi:indolepyruvate ferredoxin oxidoreductase beta subunit
MKYDMILAGVGGQGVLSIAAAIGLAAVGEGLHLKQAEVHGMSQRGGAVQSHLRIADRPIHSDLISEGQADMLLSLEPMETLRYVPFLAPDGVIVADRAPVLNIPNYPDLDAVLAALRQFPRVHLLDATAMAQKLRNARASNMVLLGAASLFLPLEASALEAAIAQLFGRKGEAVVSKNVEAFRAGRSVIQPA